MQALGKPDGHMVKTCKSDMLHLIEKDVTDIQTERRLPPAALTLDGMVILRQIKLQTFPQTFGELAAVVLDIIVKKAVAEDVRRVDVVWDTYPEVSIKSCEHGRGMTTVGVQLFHLTSEKQRVPKNIGQHLSLGKNKDALIAFIFKNGNV